MIAPARIAAYEIGRTLSAGRSDLPSAIADARTSLDDPRDRALATDIATGVQRRKATLDFLIESFARRPLARLDGQVIDVLRLSLYQLLFLSRVPASAVVNDAVDLVRRAGKSSAAGLVNAVLRSVSRQRKALPLPPRPQDITDRDAALRYFSVTLSHPRWLAERWLDRLGFEVAEQWMLFNNSAAPLTLRANPIKTTRDALLERLRDAGVAARPGRFAPDAVVIEEGQILHDALVADRDAGWFVVQDEASQLVALLAGSSPGPRVLDACASPGGKTTAFAAAVGPDGRVIAADVRASRMQLLRRTVTTAGAANVWLAQADLQQPLPFLRQFDTVVVDAPCSGLGTLRREADIRWHREPGELPAMAAAQSVMLRHAADAVRPGGHLIYATCSSEPEENEEVVARFLRSAPQFTELDVRTVHPALPAETADPSGRLRTTPDRHGLECFFGAVFARSAL